MNKPKTSASVRKLRLSDFDNAYELYKELVGDIDVPSDNEGKRQFAKILIHGGTAIFGAELNGRIVSIATLHILPNMTFGGRPYALIENVVTLREYQHRGLATQVMTAALDVAWAADAYKVMLLTGKTLGARSFYQKLGFKDDRKYGMILRRAPQRQPHNSQAAHSNAP